MTATGATIPQGQSPYQAHLRGKYDGYFGLNGHIDTPANQDYIIALFLPVKVIFQFGVFKLSAGTLTANVQIGLIATTTFAGASITGLSAIAVTTTKAETDYTSTDGTNVGVIGQVVQITVTAIAAAANLDFSLVFLRQ